ncbi:MAG: nitroreductase family protein [Clostridia bacterium]|nr:nitroreductase family protein [Clostridia bacterium]
MNEVIRQLSERKSVRVFTDRAISEADVETILNAAAQAPTAGNQQLYTIIRVTDENKKRTLVDSCDHQPFIATAKLVLIFCADCLKWYDAFCYADCAPRKPAEGDLLLAVNDALIAAQNAVVAAHSLGIGSCYIGDIMENIEIHRDLLKLPDYVFPAAMLVFGYPTEQQLTRKKPPRAALSHIVCENTYRRLDADELRQMLLKNTTADNYDHWIKAFCDRKYNSDFSREMSRSVRAYLAQFADGE